MRTRDRVSNIATGRLLAAVPEVLEVHHIAGEDCYLLKVRAEDTESLGRLLRERFGRIRAVFSTRTTIVLETVKETGRLPVGEAGAPGKESHAAKPARRRRA